MCGRVGGGYVEGGSTGSTVFGSYSYSFAKACTICVYYWDKYNTEFQWKFFTFVLISWYDYVAQTGV